MFLQSMTIKYLILSFISLGVVILGARAQLEMKGVKSFSEIEISYLNEYDNYEKYLTPKVDSSFRIYNQDGLMVEIYNYCSTNGYLEKYFYNSSKKILKTESLTSQYSLSDSHDYIYDSYGRLATEVMNSYKNGEIYSQLTFFNLYNSKGQKWYSESKNLDNKVFARHQSVYDLKGNNVMDIWLSDDSLQIREIWVTKYDTLNREIEEIEYILKDGTWFQYTYKYNKQNDWIESTYKDMNGKVIELFQDKITYDKRGNWIKMKSYRNHELINIRTRKITYL